jgi:hypothetical protein
MYIVISASAYDVNPLNALFYIFFAFIYMCDINATCQKIDGIGGRLVGLVSFLTRRLPAHGLELGNSENHCYFLTSLKGKSIIDLSFDMRINPFQKFFLRRIS